MLVIILLHPCLRDMVESSPEKSSEKLLPGGEKWIFPGKILHSFYFSSENFQKNPGQIS